MRAVERKFGMTRARRPAAGWSLRGVVAGFALLAFIVQSFATQTHIHVTGQSEQGAIAQQIAAETIAAKASASLNREHTPRQPTDDPAHCPLCQEFLLSGAYVAPVVLAIPLPAQVTTPAPLTAVRFVIAEAVSHGWNSRGPPLR
jgi:hypothetical protein